MDLLGARLCAQCSEYNSKQNETGAGINKIIRNDKLNK